MKEDDEEERLDGTHDAGPMSYMHLPVPGRPHADDGEERSDTRLRSLGIDPGDTLLSILDQLDRLE